MSMEGVKIASRNNSFFKRLVKVSGPRGVKKSGYTLLYGARQVGEILRDFPDLCEALVLKEGRKISGLAVPAGLPLYRLSPALFREVDIFGTGGPVLLLRAPRLDKWDPGHWPRGCTLFVPFQDPANVGAVIRAGAAFGVPRVVLLEESAHPFHPKCLRAAGSCLFRVPLVKGPSIKALMEPENPVVALSPSGKDIRSFCFPSVFGLLPGLEGPGLPGGMDHLETVGIPMVPGVESLNAAMATGIALFLWRFGKDGWERSVETFVKNTS